MNTLRTLFTALPLLALVLAGCAPIPPAPDDSVDTRQFIALADRAPCAGGGNRLFLIDEKYVYWDRGASCQDQVQRLYGNSPQRPLCIYVNSPNGAYTDCTKPALRSLFDTILSNRQSPDLGLGASHKVVQLTLATQDVVNVVFATVEMDAFSAIRTARNVVVRDAAAWASLWAEHTGSTPALPPVDFDTQILVASFAGDLRGCHEFEIRSVNVVGGKILVDYEDRDINPTTICRFAVTSPMHIVAIPRIGGDVEFKQITLARIDFNTIDRSAYSGVQEPMNVVVKDMASWSLLWRRHAVSDGAAPAIDFGKSMVLGVFRGVLPNGCYSTEITDIYRLHSAIIVHRVDTEPGEDAICTLAIVTPAHLIAVPRSDDPLVFSAERRTVP